MPNYKEAIKKPKDGFAYADAEQTLAYGGTMLARKHCLNPEIVFDWVKKHSVSISAIGHKLAKLDSDLLLAILNDRPPKFEE